MLIREEIRNLVKEHGAEGYLKVQKALLEGRELPNGKKLPPVRPEAFSVRALWEGLVGDCEQTLGFVQDRLGYVEMPQLFTEAVGTGAFSSAIGQLIASQVIDGYNSNAAAFIGDRLVQTVPSKLRGERFVGFTSLQGPKVVEEHASYEDSTIADKYVGTRETKRGRLLSITEEAVYFDQTGQLLARASMLGEVARQERERRIVRAVIDADSGEAVYQPSGSGTQLYASGNNNLTTGNRPLVDWTDIQEVMAFHATNVTDDRETDDALAAQPIAWMPRQILVAVEIAGNAARIVSATRVGTEPGSTSTAAMETANPLRMLGINLEVLVSAFIDNATDGDQWDDASDWLIGDFPKQFKYKEIWPLQTFRAPPQNEEQFERDIVARFKVREYGDVVCTDTRHVVKVNAA